jgi:hypothetical protein
VLNELDALVKNLPDDAAEAVGNGPSSHDPTLAVIGSGRAAAAAPQVQTTGFEMVVEGRAICKALSRRFSPVRAQSY